MAGEVVLRIERSETAAGEKLRRGSTSVNQLRRNATFTVTCEAAGFPSIVPGAYFHCRTDSAAAGRRRGGPLKAFTAVTFPVASTSTKTVTSPCTRVCRAAAGYSGRVDEINFGSRSTFAMGAGAGTTGADTTGAVTAGAVATGAGAEGGAAGGFDMRPADVSRPAEGVPPMASGAEISVIAAADAPPFAALLLGALGVLIFKFGIAGRRDAAPSAGLPGAVALSGRRRFAALVRASARESGTTALVAIAGTAGGAASRTASAATGTGCSWLGSIAAVASAGAAGAGESVLPTAGAKGVVGRVSADMFIAGSGVDWRWLKYTTPQATARTTAPRPMISGVRPVEAATAAGWS